jgi:hypothetical protein
MRKDCIRMREALQHALQQLETGPLFSLPEDEIVEVTEAMVINRLPMVKSFLRGVMDGQKPGFDEFIREKLDAAAPG